jgi:hypothetical protein
MKSFFAALLEYRHVPDTWIEVAVLYLWSGSSSSSNPTPSAPPAITVSSHKVKVELEKFSGEDSKRVCEDWVEECENRLTRGKVTDDGERKLAFEYALEKNALATFKSIVSTHPSASLTTWLDMLAQNYDVDLKRRRWSRFLSLHPRSFPTFHAYMNEVIRLHAKMVAKHKFPFTDSDLVTMVSVKMPQAMWTEILLRDADPRTLTAVWNVVNTYKLDKPEYHDVSSASAVSVVAAVAAESHKKKKKGKKKKNKKASSKKSQKSDNDDGKEFCFNFMRKIPCTQDPCPRSHRTQKAVCTLCNTKGHVAQVCPKSQGTFKQVRSVLFKSLMEEEDFCDDVELQLPSYGVTECRECCADPVCSLRSRSTVGPVTADLDSGCAIHLLDPAILDPASIRDAPLRRFVTASGNVMDSTVAGNLIVQAQGKKVTFSGARVAPDCKSNLLSVGQMDA